MTEDGSATTEGSRRRRRFLIIGGVVLAVLVVGTCIGGIVLVNAVSRLADRVDEQARSATRTDAACLELERRLNRLSPPGAAPDPKRRAVAVRAENAAVRPFLGELEQIRSEPDESWRDWIESWRQLVDARIAYAEALDREATGGEPAFFVAPQGRHGTPVVERLTDDSPDSCDGAIRRLAGPDL
ncbi:hypothetical protein WEI85_01705 [Actinomycetes bacterium KLBMP 9797]